MRIEVAYKNSNGTLNNIEFKLTRLAFIKHFVFAGMKYEPLSSRLVKILGAMLYYKNYLNYTKFEQEDCFSLPNAKYADPSHQNHFSYLAGLAIADFLSKRIDNSIYTVNYEVAMKQSSLNIQGTRPDLLAFSSNRKTFAIEAKGYSKNSVSDLEMDKHKAQACSGEINVDFSVACVSYNLYKRIRCKYYDPVNENIEFDSDLFKNLTREYYRFISKIINVGEKKRILSFYKSVEVNKESFLIFNINEIFYKEFLSYYVHDDSRGYLSNLGIIVPESLWEYAKSGLEKPLEVFEYKYDMPEALYIDNDRIGLCDISKLKYGYI